MAQWRKSDSHSGSLPKFILIEPSLSKRGGHQFEYAKAILNAAALSGYQPVLATHRKFQPSQDTPGSWRVYPLFPFRSEKISQSHPDSHFRPLKKNWPWKSRRVAKALAELFRQEPISEDDYVFYSTVHELDLSGLGRFLRKNFNTQGTQWHLQFHHNISDRTGPKQSIQEDALLEWRALIEKFLKKANSHRLYFYATTQGLVRQYNRLELAHFQELPWPVANSFYYPGPREENPKGKKKSNSPLRVLVAGGVRREKGGAQLAGLVNSLWEEFLDSGRIKLLFQVSHNRASRILRKLPKKRRPIPGSPVNLIPHPLDSEEYAKLIKGADIGLFPYHPGYYLDRCSGILVEILAAGIPVLVPQGCWLGEQIDRANQEYGNVGLTLKGLEDIPDLLRNMLNNYPRFRAAAREFSKNWQKRHAPQNTIKEMEANVRNSEL